MDKFKQNIKTRLSTKLTKAKIHLFDNKFMPNFRSFKRASTILYGSNLMLNLIKILEVVPEKTMAQTDTRKLYRTVKQMDKSESFCTNNFNKYGLVQGPPKKDPSQKKNFSEIKNTVALKS